MKFSHLFATVLLVAMPVFAGQALADGDADKGKKVFNKCRTCHNADVEKNKVGPSLLGLFGRHAGSVEGFKYSDAMKNADIVWDKETVEEYVKDPKGFIPGNKMAFVGIKDEDQLEDLLAYLEETTKKPQ
ncbi:MAG: cytochrome c family protein [Hyphomicrobiales bacterium]|nr:cytochrome c family protein [Hyphomicrobiales bacterium]